VPPNDTASSRNHFLAVFIMTEMDEKRHQWGGLGKGQVKETLN
jgi:hypothetical protein